VSDQELESANKFNSPVSVDSDASTARGRFVSRKRWWIHLILIGGYFLPLSLVHHSGEHPALTHSPQGLLVVSGIEIALFAVVFGLGWFASKATREEMLLDWRPGWWVIPLGLAYSVAIRVAVALVAIFISVILLATIFDQAQLREFWRAGEPNIRAIVSVRALRTDPVYAWLLITAVSFVIAGLREELWRAGTLAAMRALWPRAFGSRDGEIVAIALLAIAFGAAHLPLGLLSAAMASLLGLLLGLIMITHRSLWPAAIAHGCFDATSFALIAWLPANLHQLR
jgi:membrane protease YdiL (CAAX protease family)